MLELVTFPPAFGMRNVSPFCLKIEMLLASLDLPFEMTAIQDPRKAPKGKLPFLNADNECIADSELIVEFLEEYTAGKVYTGLRPAQRASGVALTRLVENHLHWMIVASRWLDDSWWPNVVRDIFGFIPGFIRPLVSAGARKRMAKSYLLHGLGGHSLEEQKGFAVRDLVALDAAVPAEGFLYLDQPCIFDFSVAAMMAGTYDNQPATWVTELAQPYENLRFYTERVQETVGVWGRK